MKHFLATVTSPNEMEVFLGQQSLQQAVASARSSLVQIFTGKMSLGWCEELFDAVHQALPSAVIAGSTSGGEIAEGHVQTGTTLISVLCFESTLLHPRMLVCQRGDEYPCGKEIGTTFAGLDNLRGVLLILPPATLDGAVLLAGVDAVLPETTLFGGGAGTDEAGGEPLVFGSEGISASGVIAVAFQSESLRIETDVFLGWEALGPRMTLTGVQDNQILTIDDQPAFNVYSRYLSIEPGEELFLLEFPLLLERDGTTIARNPVYSDGRGAVTMVADVHQGECARLGYLDIDTVVENTRGTYAALQTFHPDAILLYSCVCRRFFLQQDTELETLPFAQLAPTAGFFTYGEIARLNGKPQLLNSSQVVVAMREGGGMSSSNSNPQGAMDEDRYRIRHIRMTSRLFQFVSALTEEVEAANRLLQHKAEHDALTGAYNRHRLDEDLRNELSRAKRHDHPLSLVMFDIDHFKRINDELGHVTGDHVLRTLAQTVWEMLRKHDTMFRYGGEEFLLLLPEIDLSGALAVAEKARMAIEALAMRHMEKVLPQITVSFGVASAPQHGRTVRELLEAVDSALYRAKRNGRNRVEAAGSD